MYRRFSDFYWLKSKLQLEEKYKGCIFPPLPEKSVLGKNSQDLVDKRKQDLQLYLQILAQHSILKHDPTFKFFVTCENTDEFERFKNDPTQFTGESSIAISSLKKLQFQDTFNYLYSSIKSKYFDKTVPEEMQTSLELADIEGKIAKYLPIIDKKIILLESRIKFYKEFAGGQEDLANSFEDLQEEDAEFDKSINYAAEYYMKSGFLYRACAGYDSKILGEVKGEKLKLEGIKHAISDRKTNIEKYNALTEYAKGKMDKLMQNEANTGLISEVEKLKLDIEKVKERILKINENLHIELENYPKNRTEGLKKIMGYSCCADNEVGKKIIDFASGRQKDFPTMCFPTIKPTFNGDDENEEENIGEIVDKIHEEASKNDEEDIDDL